MAQKTDIIYIDNGDRITGEIVKLERGILEYKTDNLSTLRVKWEYVVRISSIQQFDIELESGARYIGTIEQAEEEGKMVVRVSEDIDYTVDLSSVVKIYPLRSNFWKRLTGYLDAGLSFQRANRRTEWKLGGEVNYRGERWHYRTIATSYYSNQQDIEGTTRNDASFTGQRLLKNRWIAVLATTHEQNDELNLDYRALVGGSFGRFLVQSNRQLLAAYAGVTGTREKYTDSEDIGYNAEVMIAARYEAFKYGSPKLDFITTLNVFPSITSWGRVRADFSARLSYEIFSNFFFTIDGFYNYDSQPPGELAVKHDYGIDTVITWSFK
jgi:hypothetical protein